VCWQNDAVEYYSSLGPTIDGRLKPDLVGPDSVSSGTYGTFSQCGSGFAGTSAAAPHVAGAAALLWGLRPRSSATTIREQLDEAVLDLGAAGRDDGFGLGRLDLAKADWQR
jgi:subtilisin family serine protease